MDMAEVNECIAFYFRFESPDIGGKNERERRNNWRKWRDSVFEYLFPKGRTETKQDISFLTKYRIGEVKQPYKEQQK